MARWKPRPEIAVPAALTVVTGAVTMYFGGQIADGSATPSDYLCIAVNGVAALANLGTAVTNFVVPSRSTTVPRAESVYGVVTDPAPLAAPSGVPPSTPLLPGPTAAGADSDFWRRPQVPGVGAQRPALGS